MVVDVVDVVDVELVELVDVDDVVEVVVVEDVEVPLVFRGLPLLVKVNLIDIVITLQLLGFGQKLGFKLFKLRHQRLIRIQLQLIEFLYAFQTL